MKKLLAFSMLSMVLFSCGSPEDKIKSGAKKLVEEKLLPTLKDPKSFEFVSITIDTTYQKDFLVDELSSSSGSQEIFASEKHLMETYKENVDYGMSEYKSRYEETKKEVENNEKWNDSLRTVLKTINPKEIRNIVLTETYRAKNGFGALDLGEVKVCYTIEDKKFTYWGK